MTSYLLAGGGTAGHVNPLLAIADELRRRDPAASIVVVGTAEGLEAKLVPQRGYELVTIARLPFPRRPNMAAVRFLSQWRGVVHSLEKLITDRDIDCIVGVGGFASAPAYVAARRMKKTLVIHEANARPGLANRLGARYTPYVGVAFEGTPLPHATLVGMPLRREIEQLDIVRERANARMSFGLEPARPTLVVTSGSQGARSINETITQVVPDIVKAGYQILHIVGINAPAKLAETSGYIALAYCDRMEAAFAAATLVVSRAGSATVSELTALGVPAVYVPYPVGNGEQRFNAASVVQAGGGILVADGQFTQEWVREHLIPLLRDEASIVEMGFAAKATGVLDGTARMVNLVELALSHRTHPVS
ncbi:MAG: UDP-N-acetylglucosamine--N-acetylmuramyl-(pentapeptide) pyrophosphoryl-undecaprenol N-acetylglucosamine transferase [Actinomycetales bacterium]|nr:UDP-N-acetylglucosamine--N-acetylmuramyl-(pentapeptide) pyrophosphoryl-undecaprenol N-acetylglucosamine transferase [Actinomycetales bacterium]